MELLPQFIANGLVIGSFYALSALGLTLILGLMRVVNFAHGELYMVGGVMGWWATTRLGLDFFSGLLLVAVVLGTFGWLIDRFLIERIRDQGEEPGILLTIGLSIFLANTALLLVGTAPLKIESPLAGGPLFLGPIVLTKARLFAVAVSIALMIITYLVIQKTRLGRAMRATFQDPMAAKLVGIRTANIYAGTFAMGTVIASMAGMLLGSIYSAGIHRRTGKHESLCGGHSRGHGQLCRRDRGRLAAGPGRSIVGRLCCHRMGGYYRFHTGDSDPVVSSLWIIC